GELTPPFLFRQVGSHGGQDLALVGDRDDLDRLEQFALDGRDFYVTEFVDFRSPDGLYRKYRVLVIDGVPYAKHMIASDSWNIHAEDRTSVVLEHRHAWHQACRLELGPAVQHVGEQVEAFPERHTRRGDRAGGPVASQEVVAHIVEDGQTGPHH